jgi:recombination protein RecT
MANNETQLAKVQVDDSTSISRMAGKNAQGLDVKGVAAFRALLESRQGSIRAVAASFMDPERIIKVVLNSFSKSPKLMECTGVSIFRSVLASVELGLEPGGATQQAYLVPFGRECTLIIGYRGLVELSYRSGLVASVNTGAVYEGDVFEEEGGLEPKLRHVKGNGDRMDSLLTNVYAVVKLKDGGMVYDSMNRKEVDAIRKRSRAGNDGPWVTDYAQMARKTVLRRALKLAPVSVELARALALENAVDAGETTRGILDSDFDDISRAESINARLGGPPPAPREVIDVPSRELSDEDAALLAQAEREMAEAAAKGGSPL